MLPYYLKLLLEAVKEAATGWQSVAGWLAMLVAFFPSAPERALTFWQRRAPARLNLPSEKLIRLSAFAALALLLFANVASLNYRTIDQSAKREAGSNTENAGLSARIDSVTTIDAILRDSIASLLLASRTLDSARRTQALALGALVREGDSARTVESARRDSAYAGLTEAYQTVRRLLSRGFGTSGAVPASIHLLDWKGDYESFRDFRLPWIAALLESHEAARLSLALDVPNVDSLRRPIVTPWDDLKAMEGVLLELLKEYGPRR